MTSPTVKPRLAVIEIVVADMAVSLAFYRRLGLDLPVDAESAPHVEVSLGDVTLAFDTPDTIRSFDPDWVPATGGHSVALAFECASPSDVDAVWTDLTDAGYTGHKPPWDAFWGMRYAVVHDPDGTTIDLFAPLG